MLEKPANTCGGCPLYSGEFGKEWGYVPQDGSGDNGVLVILEAAGADEEACGRPVVGAAGQYLWSALKRVGIERDGFRIHNILSCRPPNNKLIKMPYTEAAIAHCRPNLDSTLLDHRCSCSRIGRTPVVVALGKFAFRELMGVQDWHPVMKADYQTYPHWLPQHGAWLLAAPHPSHLMQGKHHLTPTLQFVFQRALEIASDGLQLDKPYYLLDPSPADFKVWVDDYLKCDVRQEFMSYDIETPYKSGKDEAEVAREDDDDYTILRCSFCYRPGNAVSVPWTADYMADIERIFQSGGYGVNWNGAVYDDVRISQYLTFNMVRLDTMLAWHVLNTSMPKGLGFVTPFYWKNCAMWKHLSEEMPAFYNAKDADAALRCWLGIKQDLINNELWDVFDRHVVQLNEVLAYMSRNGVLLDQEARQAAETKLTTILAEIEVRMQAAVPTAARRLHVYKKTPADTAGMVQTDGDVKTTLCPTCGEYGVRASHFRSVGKKRLKAGELEQPCCGGRAEKVIQRVSLWAKPLEFKLSNVGLQGYQKVRGHLPIKDRKSGSVTFDEKAMKTLVKQYPTDPLYPVIGEHRKVGKLLSTYIGITQESGRIRGGMPIGRDGRVHTTYLHNPSTLRLSSAQPNLQNLPRGGDDKLQSIIRNLVVAADGCVFGARDFGGIEAVLVGYEAKSARIIRLAKMDIHSYYTAYVLNQLDGRVHTNDLPQLCWDDEQLSKRLTEIKKEFKTDRNELMKHLVHGCHFGQQAMGARDKIYSSTGVLHDLKRVSHIMEVYHELFPEIRKWHRDVRLIADRQGFLRNAYGYIHRFSHVFANKLKNGEWEKVQGDDAEAVLAFHPQSNAAGIMKEALLRLYLDFFEAAGQYLRLTVHDEIFWECPPDKQDAVDAIVREVMEAPIKVLPLPSSYKMGPYLNILSEGKSGKRWGAMY